MHLDCCFKLRFCLLILRDCVVQQTCPIVAGLILCIVIQLSKKHHITAHHLKAKYLFARITISCATLMIFTDNVPFTVFLVLILLLLFF